MKRSGTLTTPVTGLLIIVLLMGMEITAQFENLGELVKNTIFVA